MPCNLRSRAASRFTSGSAIMPSQLRSATMDADCYAGCGGSPRRGHFGLSGVRERAAHMGGRCDVRPRHERGTIVPVELPLNGPKNTPG
jgi:hypothetical protein